MDGNRRWAKQKGLPTLEGHRQGYESLKKVLYHARDRGVKYISVYAFSTENWKRTTEEVAYLMKLLAWVLSHEIDELMRENVQMRWLGSRENIPLKLLKELEAAEAKTAGNTSCTLVLCFNYGGQREIVEAVQAIVRAGVPADSITEQTIAEHLKYADLPPLDLIVRTSNEHRLSNFMIWRGAYSELIFREELWPDFSPRSLDECLVEYEKRSRRFGG